MQTTFLTVGIACLIAAIAGGGLRAFGLEIPVLNSVPRQLVLGVLGAAFVVFSIWLIPVPPPEIAIAVPKDGEKVDYNVIVHGTISGRLPARLRYLWGAATPVSGDFQEKDEWWPQGQITPLGGGWDIAFQIGDERKDIGKDKEYVIGVFLLTNEANESFWEYKKTWDFNNPATYGLNKLLKTGQVIKCRLMKVVRR